MALRGVSNRSNLSQRIEVLGSLGLPTDTVSMPRSLRSKIVYTVAGVITVDLRFSDRPEDWGEQAQTLISTHRPPKIVGGGIVNVLGPAAEMLGQGRSSAFAITGDDLAGLAAKVVLSQYGTDVTGIVQTPESYTAVTPVFPSATRPDDWEGQYNPGANDIFHMASPHMNYFLLLAEQNPLVFNLIYVSSLLPAMDQENSGDLLVEQLQHVKDMGIAVAVDVHMGERKFDPLRRLMSLGIPNRFSPNREEALEITGIQETGHVRDQQQATAQKLMEYFPKDTEYEPRLIAVTEPNGIALAALARDGLVESYVPNPFYGIETERPFDRTGLGDTVGAVMDATGIEKWAQCVEGNITPEMLTRTGYRCHLGAFLMGAGEGAELLRESAAMDKVVAEVIDGKTIRDEQHVYEILDS